MPRRPPATPFEALAATTGARAARVHVVIDTPKGSHNKYRYDEELRLFRLVKALPAGLAFPFDFGFVPRTRSGDGDPLDAIVLIDEPLFPGCVVDVRVLGVLAATQREPDGRVLDNDRLLTVAVESAPHARLMDIRQLDPRLLAEFEHFFVAYNEVVGKSFMPAGWHDARRARRLLQAAGRSRGGARVRARGAGRRSGAR